VAGALLLCLIARPMRARAEDAAPTLPVRRLYDALLGVMKAGRSVPFATRYDQLAPTLDAAFDLPAILETSVGPSWGQLPADQQAALLAAFRRYTIDSYVSNFDAFTGQRFEISPDTRALPNGGQVVATRIIPASGDAHRLDYVMRQEGGAWKAVDVLADGTISRVAVQRSDFRRLLMEGGGPALLASLQRKASDLEAG
jgi:phospholipid transport system substrate-binding protein